MPDYGKPIENDLDFKSLLDFFRGKKDKDVKIPTGESTPSKKVLPKTMRGRQDDMGETQEIIEQDWNMPGRKSKPDVRVGTPPSPSRHDTPPQKHVEQKPKKSKNVWGSIETSLDIENDDDMGGKKGGVAGSGKGGKGGWPKKQNYGNPKPTPITLPKKAVENVLLELMKDGDQRLNAMDEDKIKEPDCCEDEDILVADGDSKRPKSEVGTNDKMFKKAHEGPEPWASKKAQMWARIKARLEARAANKATQEELPGFPPKEPELPEEEPPTPDELEHTLLKVMSGGMSEDDWDELNRMREEPTRFPEANRADIHDRLTRESGGTQPSEEPVPSHALPGFAEAGSDAPDALGQREKRKNVLHYGDKVGKPEIYENAVTKSLLKLMKIEEPRSRQAMEAEFPVRHPEGSYDPSIRVSRRSSMDRLVTPDPTQPETDAEIAQREAEAKMNRRTRGGRESGAMGVRSGTPVPDFRPGRSHMTGGAPEARKVPIGKTDMEKGGTFWGGSRKQDVPQSLPQREQPWGRQENEPRQTAGVERRIESLTANRRNPKNPYSSDQGMGNLGAKRGQRKTKSMEKENVGGQGVSNYSEGFDLSKPLPKAPITGPDHPEGPGVPLTDGWTALERETMEETDPHSGRKDYAQDPDAVQPNPLSPYEPSVGDLETRKERRRETNRRSERKQRANPKSSQYTGKRDMEESLLKLMKANPYGYDFGKKNPWDDKIPTLARQGRRVQSEVGRVPEKVAERVGAEFNPEVLGDIAGKVGSAAKGLAGKLPGIGSKTPAEQPKDTQQNYYSVENSLLKLMKEGEITPSKVGMAKENATKDLEKVVLPQAMGQQPGVMNPVAKRTAPVANPSSHPTALETETGGGGGLDVGRKLEYDALSQTSNIANKLLGIKQPGEETGTLPGAIAGGVKAGMGAAKLGGQAGLGAAKKVLGAFGGGKPNTDPSGASPNPTSSAMNYYSRDMKK